MIGQAEQGLVEKSFRPSAHITERAAPLAEPAEPAQMLPSSSGGKKMPKWENEPRPSICGERLKIARLVDILCYLPIGHKEAHQFLGIGHQAERYVVEWPNLRKVKEGD